MLLFKFKKGNSKISPKVGTYFNYGSDMNNIFKITKISDNTCFYAWTNRDFNKIHQTQSGIFIKTFIDAVIDNRYRIILEEDYHTIPKILREFKI